MVDAVWWFSLRKSVSSWSFILRRGIKMVTRTSWPSMRSWTRPNFLTSAWNRDSGSWMRCARVCETLHYPPFTHTISHTHFLPSKTLLRILSNNRNKERINKSELMCVRVCFRGWTLFVVWMTKHTSYLENDLTKGPKPEIIIFCCQS